MIRKHFLSVLPIVLILIVAAGLRFYKFADQPFTHDEFSTLFRLHYDNIHDLIKLGVYEDGHPAGFHVYSYLYTKIFGESERAVKFPIILFGIFSVFMVYVLGKKWFNTTAGIYAASFMAFLQYAVAQSQVARMYGFGLPFVLLMAYYWDQLITQNFSIKNAVLYVLMASICSYTHYFSLLFTAIVWISGLFIIDIKLWRKYFLVGFSIFLLFVPHLGIFFHQLAKGGIQGWLGAFKWNYFFFYLSFVFHHSYVVALLVIVPIILYFNYKIKGALYRRISLLWFITPMLIGFTYSALRNNVVHERVLYFSFPFLLLFLASFIKKVTVKTEIILSLVILLLGSGSLFIERKHQQIFNNQRYKMVANACITWSKNVGKHQIQSFKATHKKIDAYYNKKQGFTDNSVFADDIADIGEFKQLLDTCSREYFYFGQAELVNRTFLALALHYFPEIVAYKYAFAGEAYLLKKSDKLPKWPCAFFHFTKLFDKTDTLAGKVGLGFNQEFLPILEAPLDSLIFSGNNVIELSATLLHMDTLGGAKIVSDIFKNGKSLDWRSSEVDAFMKNDSMYHNALFTIPIPEIHIKKNATIKIYIWNPQKATYLAQDFSVVSRAANPFIYSGIRKIPLGLNRYCLNP